MNKYVLTLLLWVCALLTYGQSMSDAQVMKYIQREMKAGTSQQQIAIKLMQRGVDMKQLQTDTLSQLLLLKQVPALVLLIVTAACARVTALSWLMLKAIRSTRQLVHML